MNRPNRRGDYVRNISRGLGKRTLRRLRTFGYYGDRKRVYRELLPPRRPVRTRRPVSGRVLRERIATRNWRQEYE